MIRISIQEKDFSLEQEISLLRSDRLDIGAIASFTGLVRDLNEGDEVSLVSLEHYPGMTEKQLQEIAQEAESRWPLQGITIIHRVGTLAPGDQIVLVITASPHRAVAYESNQFIMDYLKTRATFWKKETLENRSRWVENRHSDDVATKRWKKPA
ncbi:MAG: molybdopterin synthase catalytic subunit MoaE [Gammaproteobacteria bacterium]|nr:MAG: molybdopterin synthase catalytic subunit MoaE [Gammaproteobacteria bacterium]